MKQSVKEIPHHILKVYSKMQDAGFEVFFVGGCVRDMMIGKNVKDWDMTTSATPEEILKVFPDGFYDNQFGTVGVPITLTSNPLPGNHGEEVKGEGVTSIVEITTYRTERNYTDSRHPTEVAWGKTIEEDLQRRDFTINAIAMKISGEREEIVDPYNGQEDAKNHLVKAVGNPSE